MIDDRQVKNTAPAVMEDIGPRGTTRKKSKDGRYTANYSLEQEDEYKDKRQVPAYNNHNDDEDLINDYVYEPLFIDVMEKTMIAHLRKIALPGQEAYLIKSNTYNDKKLGIDFQLGLRTKGEGFVSFDPKKIRNVDLKVVDTFNKDNLYEQPSFTINLWKRYPNRNWEHNSYLNKNHANNAYCYIFPKSEDSKKLIKKQLAADVNYRPRISEAKMAFVPKKTFETYVDGRIVNNPYVKNLINAYMNDDLETIADNNNARETGINSYEVSLPVPGETFKMTLLFKEREDGYREIRVKVPATAFNNIKGAIIDKVSFDNKI